MSATASARLHRLSLFIDTDKDEKDRELGFQIDDSGTMTITLNGDDILGLDEYGEFIPADACIRLRDFLNYCLRDTEVNP